MNVKILRLCGFFGMIAPFVGFGMVGISISMAPWFSWVNNALSDLGVEGFGSAVFNSGLAMAAAVMMMFSAGLFELSGKDIIGRIGSLLHILSAGFLIGIGVFNETVKPYHFYVSVGFFVSLPLAVAVMSVFLFISKMKAYAVLGWGVSVLAILIWVLPWKGVAIPEAFSALCCSIWQVALAWWMWRQKEDTG